MAKLLELNHLISQEDKFINASMLVCNEFATRHQCEKVSIGFLIDDYVKLQSISHSDEFSKKKAIVRKLELAMGESIQQDMDLMLPAELASTQLHHFLTDYQADAQSKNIVLMIMRYKQESFGVR